MNIHGVIFFSHNMFLRPEIIEIEREIVELEERAAKSKIYSLNKNGSEYKIGIIDLPSFYLDFEAWQARDPNYKSSSKDVKNILVQEENLLKVVNLLMKELLSILENHSLLLKN